MLFGKIAIAILPKSITIVNTNNTLESLSINDLLENIKFLIECIISKKCRDRNKKFCLLNDKEKYILKQWVNENRLLNLKQSRW